MRKITLFILACFILGCTSNKVEEYNEVELAFISEFKDTLKREIEEDANKRVFGDTVGLSKAPVKVLTYKIVGSRSGSYRNVSLSYKNISGKKIDAMKFRWIGEDAFGDPANMGNLYAKGYGGGFDDDGLKVNEIKDAEWSILSRNAKNVTLAWTTDVVFSDGSKWELGD